MLPITIVSISNTSTNVFIPTIANFQYYHLYIYQQNHLTVTNIFIITAWYCFVVDGKRVGLNIQFRLHQTTSQKAPTNQCQNTLLPVNFKSKLR